MVRDLYSPCYDVECPVTHCHLRDYVVYAHRRGVVGEAIRLYTRLAANEQDPAMLAWFNLVVEALSIPYVA